MPKALSMLPQQTPAKKKAGGFAWGKLKAKSAGKPVLPVVEVKKAIKLMKGAGKSIVAIELMPQGGFRVVAAGQPQPASPPSDQPPNPWDEILDE